MGINNMVYVGQVKRSEGFDRANLRFAGKILYRHTAATLTDSATDVSRLRSKLRAIPYMIMESNLLTVSYLD